MNLPESLLTRLTNQFGIVATRALLLAMSEKRLPTFRVNTLKGTDENVMSTLRECAIQFERVKDVPHAFLVKNKTDKELLAHALTTSGKIYLQGLTSMLPALVLDPQPEETILDLCAAPGSKTSQIAALMKNTGRLVACEIDEVRFQKLEHTLALQSASAETIRVDATLLHTSHPEQFDRVLADVPCSAEGRMNLNDRRSFSWSQKYHRARQTPTPIITLGCRVSQTWRHTCLLNLYTCSRGKRRHDRFSFSEFPFMKPMSIALPFPTKQGSHKTATLYLHQDMKDSLWQHS